MITAKSKLKVALVPLKNIYLTGTQGIDLKRAHVMAMWLQEDKNRQFPPLLCEKDRDRFAVSDGKHRYIAYLGQGIQKAWCVWDDAK